MLLINIHHYIMGLAGSARGGRGTRAAAAAGRGSRGRIPDPARRRGGWGGSGGERIPKWGPGKGRRAQWEEPDGAEGSSWENRRADGRSLGKGRGTNEFLPAAACGFWVRGAGALESPERG